MIQLIILAIIYLFGFFFIMTDPKKHFLMFFVLIIYFIYQFLGPLNTLQTKDYYIFENNFRTSYDDVIFMYIIFISSMLLFYVFGSLKKTKNIASVKNVYVFNPKSKYYVIVFFLAVSFIVSRKTSAVEDDFSGGFLNYLLFLSDSLILAFLILIFEKKLQKYQIVLLIMTLAFYLILGFRYRVILFLIGLIYYFYINNKISIFGIFRWIFGLISLVFIINFISINRQVFRDVNFSKVTFESKVQNDVTPYQFFINQTANHKTDMSVIKYMNRNQINSDYGESMFLDAIYRVVPASFFETGKKPAIPQQEIIRNSFNSTEGQYAGAAVTNTIEYYIAFGYFGVLFFSGLIGYFMGRISNNIDRSDRRDLIKIIIVAMFLFQEITRAYLPQNLTLLAFLLLTFKLFYIKKKSNARYIN